MFLTVLVSFVAAYFYFHLNPSVPKTVDTSSAPSEQLDAAPPTPTTSLDPPVRLLGHVVSRFPNGGLLIECKPGEIYASRSASLGMGGYAAGGDQGDVFGRMRLLGHPKEMSLADGDEIDTNAQQAGIAQFKATDSSLRTVKSFHYYAPPTATADPPSPGSWMWKNKGALDRRRQ